MATTVTFNDGTNPIITVAAPRIPEEPGRSYPVQMGRTIGGGLFTVDLGGGTVYQTIRLHFRHLSSADYTDLKTLLETDVNFGETSFTYTDPHGVAHTNMHYVSGWESFRSARGDRWNGTLIITKDLSA